MFDHRLDSCVARFSRLFGAPRSSTHPTDSSISKIQAELGFRIPADFIEFAERCPVYASWFASIGIDYDDPLHILRINQQYRSPEYGALPKDLVVINHGYDGDLTCYDLSKADAQGRISICHCDVPENANPLFDDRRLHLAYTIYDYLNPNLNFWERHRRNWSNS